MTAATTQELVARARTPPSTPVNAAVGNWYLPRATRHVLSGLRRTSACRLVGTSPGECGLGRLAAGFRLVGFAGLVGRLGADHRTKEPGPAAGQTEEAASPLGPALHRAGHLGDGDHVGHDLPEGVGIGEEPRMVAGHDLALGPDGGAEGVEGALGDDAVALAPENDDREATAL